MEYFRRKEREGTAIIMEFSTEQLLDLDFGFWANKNQEEITDMEVEQWLANHAIEVRLEDKRPHFSLFFCLIEKALHHERSFTCMKYKT